MASGRGVACGQGFVGLACLVAGVAVSNALGGHDPAVELRPVATITIDGVEGTPILAADGVRIVAASYDAGPIAWNPATGESRDVGICDTETIQVARAGNQVASVCLDDTNTMRERDLDVAWLDHKRPGFDVPVWTLASADLRCVRSCLGNIAGAGNLLVFDTFNTQRAKTQPGRWWLWRIIGNRSMLLRTDPRSMAVVAVDSGRIFVRLGGQLVVLDPSGRQLASYASPGPGRVVVSGKSLVVRTRRGVSVFDLERGLITHRWRLPTQAVLQDTDATSFVYTTNLTLHIHHLTAPSEATFTLSGVEGPINAQVTAFGLFYSWQDIKCCTGYVAFVPTAALPAAAR
jgi:hypothetical protein